MDIENLIADTFTAHEHDAPDGAPVLAAARRRIDRSRAVRIRPLAVAAGVVLLALGAVTVVVLNRPADPGQVNVAGGGHTTVSMTSTQAKAPARTAIAGLAMPYSLGWLPQGKVDYLARRINLGSKTGNPHDTPVYDGEYMLDVTSGRQVLLVDVQEMRMFAPDDAQFKSGPGRDVTIGGRTGVESKNSGGPGGYELYLTNPNGGSVYVNVAPEPGSTASAQQLVDTGRRVAQHLAFPGSTTVTPAFGLRDLPSDKRMCAFDVGRGFDSPGHRSAPSTSYSLGTCTTQPDIEVGTTDPGQLAGEPGKPVQGHKTRYQDGGAFKALWVLDAVNGAPIRIEGPMSQTELYDLANHLVLPH